MNYTEFSKKIKEKYPYYNKVDDKVLAEKMIAKYPYYKDKVTFDIEEQPEGNSVKITDVFKNMLTPVTKPVETLTDTSVKIENTAEESVKPATQAISETVKNLNPIEQTKDIVNSATVKPYRNVEPSLRARTEEDDNSKVIYEPDSFDILGEQIAVASAADKGATTTKDLEDIKKKQNFAMMTAGVVPFVAGGQMSVGGLAILEGIQQAKNYVSSKIQGKDYDFMAYENLSSLLPDNTPSVVRVVSSLAEMVADCVVAGRLETAGRNFLINEAVTRLETKMKGAGYTDEQVKTASDNLKKEIVKRETGLKEENGQVVQTEAKPMNIDEAVKLNVDVEKLKVPKAEQPKETIKADVEVEEIKEPKQIKPVEEVNNDTWHGSGEDFDEFDLSMPRTGEGSNVHGWGTYLSPKRDVAEGYAKTAGKRTGKHFLYRVSAPSRELLLDEQKTLEEQPKIVKSAMLKILPKISNYNDFVAKLSSSGIDIKKTFDTEYKTEAYEEYLKDPQKYNEEMYKKDTGKELYKLLTRQEMSAKDASLKLNELGVKGLTYEGSKDGINFVIFDKKSMKILDKINLSAKEVKPTETVKVTEEVKPTEEYIGDFKDEASIRKLIDRNIENSSKENIDKFLEEKDVIAYTPETSNKLSKPNLKSTSVTINSPQRIGLDSLYLKKGIFTNGVIAVFDKDLAGKLYKEWRKTNINYYAKQESGKTRKEKLDKATKSYDAEVKTKPVVKIENVIPDLKTYKEIKPAYITKWEKGSDAYMVVFDNGICMNLNTYNTIKDNIKDAKPYFAKDKGNKPVAFLNNKGDLVAIAMPVRGTFEEGIKNYNELPKQILNRVNTLADSDLENEDIINEIYKATKTDMVNYSKEDVKKLEELERELPQVEYHKDYMQRFKPEQIAESRKYLLEELKDKNTTTERKKEIKDMLDLYKEKETPEGQQQILNAEKEYNDLVKKIDELKNKDKKQKEEFVKSLKERLSYVDKDVMSKREREKKDLQKRKIIDRIKEIDREVGYYDTEIFLEERIEQRLKEKKDYHYGIPDYVKKEYNKAKRYELLQERETLIKDLNEKDLEEIEKAQSEVQELNAKEIEERTFQEREDIRVADAFIKDYNKPYLTEEKLNLFAEGGKKANEELSKLTPQERLEVKFAILKEYGLDNALSIYSRSSIEERQNFKVELAKLGYVNEDFSYLGFGKSNSKDKRDLQSLVKERTGKSVENTNVATSKTDFSKQTDVELPKVTKTHDELIKKSEIIKDLAKETDLPVKIGGTQRKNILGLYYMKEELVRLQVANDMLTLAHEIGHHEEKVLFGGVYRKFKDFTPEQKEFYKELKPLATKPAGNETRGKMFSEGMAQFISMFVNNPEQAQKVAPKFYEYFTKNAPEKTPKVYNALVKAQTRMSKYYTQNNINKVKNHISFERETEKLTPKEWLDKKLTQARTQLFDRLEPLRKSVQEIYKRAGLNISDTDPNNPYFIARLNSGSVGRAEVFLKRHTYDFKTLQKTGKSFQNIIQEIEKNGGDLETFATYLVSHDTIELAPRGINTGVELGDAIKTVKELEPIYGKYAEDIYQYRLSLLKMLKDGQIISQEAYDNIVNKSKRYAPLQRVLEDDVNNITSGDKNFKTANPIKSIKGSGRDIINPLETIVNQTYSIINLVEKNRVGLALAKLANLDKSGAFVFKRPHKVKTIRTLSDKEELVIDNDINENNEIRVFIDGKPVVYEVYPEIAKIVNGLTLDNKILFTRWLENVATIPAKTLKFGTTDVSLPFALKNILRDFPLALISSENKFNDILNSVVKITALGLKAMTNKQSREEWNDIVDLYNKSGAGQSLLINDNRNSTIKAIDDLRYTGYLDKIWNKVKEKDFIEATKSGIVGATELVRAIVGFLEQVPRLAEFVESLKGKPLTKENLEQAGFNARKITLDFASGGSFSKLMNKYIPYFNAFFLGIDKLKEVFKDQKQFKRLLGMFGVYAIARILEELLDMGSEEVNDVNRTQKYTNFVVKIGDTIYRIPKTIELAPFYTTIDTAITMIADTIKGKKKENAEYIRDIIGSMKANLSPDFMLQAVKLPYELSTNKSMFFGTPIVSAELEKVLPEYQYTEYTTELSKFIAKTLGNIGINKGVIADTIGSPQRLEYIVKSITGTTGRFFFEEVDKIGRLTGALPEKEYELPEKTLADIPFIRAFVIRYPQQSRTIEDFYEKYKELKQYSNSFRLSKKRADIQAIQELAIYKSVDKVDKITKTMGDVRKTILTVYTDKNMSKDEKRQNIDELMLMRLALAKQGLNMMKEIEQNIKGEL